MFLRAALLSLAAVGSQACTYIPHPHYMPHSLQANPQNCRPLEWGQLNFIHTTDVHGYMGGHHHDDHFGADWGHFYSFVSNMRQRAKDGRVDLLVVDTGDLHDGNGLSDATNPNGKITNELFRQVDYDLLTIGNHELMSEQVAYETRDFARQWGDKYLTTNVQLPNNETGEQEYIGHRYRYFTTARGLRIMAFGIYGDHYTSQAGIVSITSADDLIKSEWWSQHVERFSKPIDMFVILTHQPFKPSPDIKEPTITKIFKDIRARRPDVPIQFFGGHTHVRDFAVLDQMATGIESGAFADTVGWTSLSGLNLPTYFAAQSVKGLGLPSPSTAAVPKSGKLTLKHPKHDLKYSRRYLDWNVNVFTFHSGMPNLDADKIYRFDTEKGKQISQHIREVRKSLHLDDVLGCVPQDYYYDIVDPNSVESVFTLWKQAVSAVVVNPTRATTPRLILTNGLGGASSNVYQGRFTRDDAYIAYSGPAQNFFYLADVQHSVISGLSIAASQIKQANTPASHQQKGNLQLPQTKDDFGDDGDDTPRKPGGPTFTPPLSLVSQGGFNDTVPEKVDVVVVELAVPLVVETLREAGLHVSANDFKPYIEDFTTKDVWEAYAKKAWQKETNGCKLA